MASRRQDQSGPIRTALRFIPILLLLLTLPLPAQDDPFATPAATTRVGIPVTLSDLYIPGGEARPIPRPNHESPLVIRVLEVKPAANGRRYDLEIYGLEEGSYDLADFLEAANPASPPQFGDPISITITTDLPPGLPKPSALTPDPPARIGGYRTTLWILGALWVLGLAAFLFLKKRGSRAVGTQASPPTLAERLGRLVTLASQGELDADQQASLERLILGHWRQRLPELDQVPPAEALAKLRHHDEAGPLIRQLESWLHARNRETDDSQIDELLAPYRN